ncbi:MAG: DoxX family protein [Bacteroidetes bacterium]|nr:DoxX family protein [Bacteroidota bacterium]MBS1756209.1 DoxX family protein [Bacteroidota bacterium]
MESKTVNYRKASNQPKWLTLIRIVLGFILIWKGFIFFKDSTGLEGMMRGTGLDMFANYTQTFSFIVTYVSLLGGVFIAVGFLTRLMCLIQIPILLGAIIFINSKAGMSFSNTELVLSIIVFLLLLLFLVKGSGVLSADEFFRSYNKAGEEQGHTKEFFQ